jgi:hypothetical protein
VDADPSRAFEALFAAPREAVFVRRFGAFPPVTGTRGQDGAWDSVGESRTLVLGDGGTLRETLTSVDRPHRFEYVLDDIHGKLRPFVTRVDGVWTVTPEDGRSRIGWAWTLHPARPPALLTMGVIGRMWQGYADRALRSVEDILRG